MGKSHTQHTPHSSDVEVPQTFRSMGVENKIQVQNLPSEDFFQLKIDFQIGFGPVRQFKFSYFHSLLF